MHIADMTMFYAPVSGGVRGYLEAKHRRLQLYPEVRHSLLLPGSHRGEQGGVFEVPAPLLPLGRGQRMPWRRGPWRRLLDELTPDLIEAGDLCVSTWAALDAGRRLGVPVIGVCHSDLPRLAGQRLGRWFGSRLEPYVARLYQRFDRVLAPSAAMAETLLAQGVADVYVQPLGVDLETFHPRRSDSELRRSLGLDEQIRLLIHVGHGFRENHLDTVLEALSRLGPNYHLLLVGDALPRRLPANVSAVRRFCPAEEVARLMASADLLVQAGTEETFALTALEAMACGIPVVAARAGALAEVVPECGGRLCDPLDSLALANGVAEAFEADVFRLGRQARGYVEAHHAWDAVVAGLLAHYLAVLGSVEQPMAVHG